MTDKGFPLVSLIVPCYNEENFISLCLNSVLNNDYPKDKMEILIVDGMSTDKTLEIAKEIINKHRDYNIRILQNPRKIFPSAVNIGIKNAQGEYIFILGAHAEYDASYIRLCVETAKKYNADNTGGVLQTVGLNHSSLGKSIANVLSSPFGVGNSVFRTGTSEVKEADTVFGGCYHRSVFEKIGYFNENLISTSDMDFNVRLKKNGGRIILNPDIKVKYYTRNSFDKFIKNNFRNGFWAIYPIKFVNYLPVSFRHLVPLLFVLGLLVGAVLSIFFKFIFWLFISGIAVYLLMSLIFSMFYLRKGLYNLFLMPFLFFLLHVGYGLGSLIAGFKVMAGKFFF